MSKKYPDIFVVTGAESTGKSMLTEQLASYYNAPFYPEFAREYILKLNRNYNQNDVEFIARKQIQQFQEVKESNHKLVFFDTWLIITKVWFEVVYNQSPDWISKAIKNAGITGFIVNDIDIPWEPDNVRENGGESRKKLHDTYLKNLDQFKFKYTLNQGLGETRLNNAIRYIEKSIK